MRKFATSLILALLIASCATTCNEQEIVVRVNQISISELLENPRQYDGKTVEVTGRLSVSFENVSVHSSGKSVWVKLTKEQLADYRQFDGFYGYVRGTFDSRIKGHMGQYSGGIKLISRFGE